jgi:hypothetical protein
VDNDKLAPWSGQIHCAIDLELRLAVSGRLLSHGNVTPRVYAMPGRDSKCPATSLPSSRVVHRMASRPLVTSPISAIAFFLFLRSFFWLFDLNHQSLISFHIARKLKENHIKTHMHPQT